MIILNYFKELSSFQIILLLPCLLNVQDQPGNKECGHHPNLLNTVRVISTIHQSRNCDTGLLSWIPVLARTPVDMMDLSGDCDNTESNVQIIYVTGCAKTGHICTNYTCSENSAFLSLCL